MSSKSGWSFTRGAVCALVLTVGAAALQGCGKQGNPMPPLRVVPARTADLKVRQQDQRLLLDFSFPQTTPTGLALGGITAVEVWEAVQPAPREGVKPAPIDARIFQSAATLKMTIGTKDLPEATFGSRILVPLPLPALPAVAAPAATPAPGTTATPTPPAAPRIPMLVYAVRTIGPLPGEEKSEFSNQVAIVPGTPPSAPERLSVTARPDGVLVEWSGTDGATGYNIYRRGAVDRTLGQPIHTSGAEERSWVDNGAQMGQSYIYGVTAVAGQEPLVESGVASEQEVRFQDRFPPPPPLELVALAEGGRVRLVWRAAEADDLAGYLIYRRGSQGDFTRLTSQPLEQATEYMDTTVSPGETYSYRVTSVDRIGNESGPGAEVRASVPQ